jgi:hypothetical protein
MESNIDEKIERGISTRTQQVGISTRYPICKFHKLYNADEAWNNGKAIEVSWKSISLYTLKNTLSSIQLYSAIAVVGRDPLLHQSGTRAAILDCVGTHTWWDTGFISGFVH